MHFPAFDSVKLNRAVARLFYSISGLPRCAAHKIETEVSVLDIPEEELKYFSQSREQLEISHILWFLWFLLYIFKGLYFAIYMIIAVSTMEVSSNNDAPNRAPNSSSYGCLITNCTRLSKDNTLLKDLIELPVFAICHPDLSKIYIPLISAHSIGLNIYTVFTYFVSIVGVFFPIENYLNPRVQDSRAFPFNPTFSIRYHRERARRYLVEVFTSMKNYYCDPNNHESDASRGLRKKTNLILEIKEREDFMRKADKSDYLAPEKLSLNLLGQNYIELDRDLQDYVGDCVPLARTYSWATRISELRAYMFIFLFFVFLMGFTGGIWIMVIFANGVLNELIEIDSFANDLGCGFWIDSGSVSGGRSRISLGESVLFNNLAYLFDYAFILIPGCFILSLNVVNSLVSIQEVDFMLSEQLVHIDLAIKFADLLRSEGNKTCSETKGVDIINQRGCFNMNITRISTTKDTGPPFRRPKPLDDQYALEVIAENHNYNEQCTNLDSFVDLVTKIFISNRIIKNIARDSSPPVTVILSFAYAASYVSVALVISINRKFESNSLAPIALAMVGLVATNTLIITASRVQSTTNCLIRSLWRLVAKADDIMDFRVRHIRRLMIKQAIVMSFEGTLKIKAFGLSVTYASLIEAVIWSSTLAIYSFNT